MFGYQTSRLKNVQCCNCCNAAKPNLSFSNESSKIQFWTIRPSERAKTCASTVTMSRIKISQTKRILGFICWNNVQEVNLTCRQLTFSEIVVFGPLNTNNTFHQSCKLPNRSQIKILTHDVRRFQLFPALHICIKGLWTLLTWCKRPRTCSTTPFQKLAAIVNRDRIAIG